MNLTDVRRPNQNRRYKFRIGKGEGSGLGKTSGRGTKGFWSRTGASQRPWFEGGQMPLIRRVPKRGFSNRAFQTAYTGFNVGLIASRFAAGETVDPSTLAGKGIKPVRGRGIKILGGGEVGHKLAVRAHAFSASARVKIEKAGGTCEVLPRAPSKPRGKEKAAGGSKG